MHIDRQGTITRLAKDGGNYGFIHEKNGPLRSSVFFHRAGLVGLVFDEQLIERRVVFELTDTPRGPKAVNVRAAE